MVSTWVSVIAMLAAFVNGAREEAVPQPCVTIQTSSTVVFLGSPVTATCVTRDDCTLVTGKAVRIEWRLNSRSLPDNSVTNESSGISEVFLQSFNDTRAVLTCRIIASPGVIVAGARVEIRAGYPPSAPENLYCITPLTAPGTISCSWDPGQRETHLLTQYSLHTHIRYSNENFTYKLLPGEHSYTIPRSDFVIFSEMEIYVKVMNELGETTSDPVILKPISPEAVPQPCATIQTSSSVVSLGSPVTATCVIRDDCTLVTGKAVRIEWRLNDRSLPDSSVTNESSRTSEVVLQSFNDTRAVLTCCIQASPAVIVGGVEIRAGYPPSAPENLYCITNLTTPITISCSWDPGQRETHLLTQYSLHTHIRYSNENFTYEPRPGKYHYTIPRSDFVIFSEMEIYVKVMNELGETTSDPVILEPISAAKFDPPKILNIQAIPKRYGCLTLRWALSLHQSWIQSTHLNLQVRLRTTDHGQRSEQIIAVNHVKARRSVDQCRLLHGTRYISQIRVRYQQSPWSEWSSSQSGVTLESAPTGRLDSWVKTSGDQTHKQRNVHLFWKPSKQFRPNSQNVSYVVSLQKGEKGQVCVTARSYCSFQLPAKAKKVYLSAVNAAGKSTPTEVRIYTPKAHSVLLGDILVSPYDDRSLLVQWTGLDSSALTGYVVEWRPLLQTDPSFVGFDITDRNQSSHIITGSFEPYKPYGISVYPRFKDGIGLPQTANAYSRQKAPSMAPKMRIQKTWQSHVELTWDEIPLNQRNGIIQSYRVFYWAQGGPVNVVNAKPDERRVLLKDLNSRLLYEAFMMVSTVGGNYNGSVIHIGVEPFDAVAVVMISSASCVALSLLLICLAMACFNNHKRLKMNLWPNVPDPANSSIRKWSSETLQESLRISESEEPNPVYLSHLSFLDLPMTMTKEEDDPWLKYPEDTSDLGESICGSPFIPGYSGTHSDSVPYATVICSSSCSSPPSKDCHVYLRSESTQPLLEAEEAFTPKCYQIMPCDRMMKREQCFFGPCPNGEAEGEADIAWDEFPFLQALAMNETQND